MAGYSPTPLYRKLGLKAGVQPVVIAPPRPYDDLLGIPTNALQLSPDDPLPQGMAYLHLFTIARSELADVLTRARPCIAPDAIIWVSWPKKASRRPTDITEDVIRTVCLPMGYVDIKVCAVDEVWSGLKLMIRKSLR